MRSGAEFVFGLPLSAYSRPVFAAERLISARLEAEVEMLASVRMGASHPSAAGCRVFLGARS